MAWSRTKKTVVAATVIGVLAGIGFAGGLVARAARRNLKEISASDELIEEGSFEWDGGSVEWALYRGRNGRYRIVYDQQSERSSSDGDLCCYATAEEAGKAMLDALGTPRSQGGRP